MIIISNLILEVHDGNTIASTEVYGVDKKTYINIESGNVFYLTWELDSIPNDSVDHFNVVIKRYDPTLNVFYDILYKNVGYTHAFYVNADILPKAPLQYILSIYIVAYGKYGSVITSNIETPYVCKGSGTYVKVEYDDYSIMKRALAFAKTLNLDTVTLTSEMILKDIQELTLYDIDEKVLTTSDITIKEFEASLSDQKGRAIQDATGNDLFAVASKLLYSVNGWDIIQDSYTKDDDGNWQKNDIEFEMLIIKNKESEKYGETVEVVIGKDANGDSIYEPLYVL